MEVTPFTKNGMYSGVTIFSNTGYLIISLRKIYSFFIPIKEEESKTPSEPATFVQRLPNVFQTSMTFETRWVVVVHDI